MNETTTIKHRNRKKIYDYDIHVKITREMFDTIKEQAKEENVNYTALLRKMIQQYLDRTEWLRKF